jgi:hypothetical protein
MKEDYSEASIREAEDLLVKSELKGKHTLQVVAELLEVIKDQEVIIEDLKEEVAIAKNFRF